LSRHQRRFVALVERVDGMRAVHENAAALIASGLVHVDGRIVTNPRSRVARDAAIRIRRPHLLRGTAKLAPALERFTVPVAGRIALDVGAAAGGFTSALLDAGATRVYAVDAGWGQLRSSLRNDPRVIDLERHNVGDLDRTVVPEPIALVTIDVSYLALAAAVPELGAIDLDRACELVALVKPAFELGLSAAPTDPGTLRRALSAAASSIERAGWSVAGTMESPVRGSRGAVEFLIHARRAGAAGEPSTPGDDPRSAG
jgi:23S rRNA (cytidine1920-2'-O)/16S rRNA (cytidine1409-2'-O)-methyltransferase